MDILIKNMEMPKDGTITIEIRHDGAVDFIGNMGSNLGRLVDVKAVALPEHGRLISDVALLHTLTHLKGATEHDTELLRAFEKMVRECTTIVEASK